jgi:hypothetical protein
MGEFSQRQGPAALAEQSRRHQNPVQHIAAPEALQFAALARLRRLFGHFMMGRQPGDASCKWT